MFLSDTLGLMHSVKHLHDRRARPSTSHSFTHLTLQEFLAARHWSQLPLQQLTEVLQRQNLFPIQQYMIWKGSEKKMEFSFRNDSLDCATILGWSYYQPY